jgi:hypothetical protein
MDSSAKRAMRCRAASLSNVYVLVVGALTEGDLDVKPGVASRASPSASNTV